MMAHENESALASAARRGDREALRRLLMCNWAWLKALVFSVVPDVDELDDILQDICVRVISKIHTLREPERFKPWLAVLARRQALRHRQQKSQRPISLSEAAVDHQCDERANESFKEIEKQEECKQILEAVNGLPVKYREVFMLQHIDNLSYTQIAEVLDVPVTTVQIRLVRARRMINDNIVGLKRDIVRRR